MPTYNGKLKKVGCYKLDEPKTFAYQGKSIVNTHRLAVETDIGWIGFGETNNEDFIVKDDEGKWKILGSGSEVVIKYTENGNFKNAKKSSLMILDLVEGEKFTKETGVAGQTPMRGKGGGNFNLGIELGHAANNATQMAIAIFGKNVKVDKVEELTKDFYVMMKGLRAEFEKSVEKPAPKPKAAPQPAQEEDDFKDDIPF